MESSNLKLAALKPILFLSMLTQGCAQTGMDQKWNTQSSTCLSCHSTGTAGNTRDFSPIYASRRIHHPVGVVYPQSGQAGSKFKQPDAKIDPGAKNDKDAFFDTNGNGKPDNNEIQLFVTSGALMVECASCHENHVDSPASVTKPAGPHLRGGNDNSTLCFVCHNF